MSGIMNWMVRTVTDLEVNMNSVERVIEYEKHDEEAPKSEREIEIKRRGQLFMQLLPKCCHRYST
jgi:hypothetical protein